MKVAAYVHLHRAWMSTGPGHHPDGRPRHEGGSHRLHGEAVVHERLLSAIDYAQLAARVAALTQRERQVMNVVVKGASSKSIARLLNISQRTVEKHRAAVMKRTGATSLSELIRTVMQLGPSDDL